jgi:hypothetical protein
MTKAESNSVQKLKRPFLWLVLVIAVAGVANWSEQKFVDNRAQEIRAIQGPNSAKRIAGSQPPTSAALLLQLRLASAMLDPSGPQPRRGFSAFNDDPTNPARRDESRDDQLFRSSNSRTNPFSAQGNSQSFRNSFSSQFSTSPYVASPNSGFGRNSAYDQSSSSYSYGQSPNYGQSSSSTSRTNTRNQNDASSGLLGPDNPN